MKPLDPRLLHHARAARRYIVTTTITGILTAGLVIGQAALIAHAMSPVIEGRATMGDAAPLLLALAGVFAARGLVLYVQEALAHRAATDTVIDLRRQVLTAAAALGPRWQATHGADTVTLATRGLDDLEPYFTRYLPQLLLAATVTPATVVVMLTQDLPSTVAVVLTIPLIPIFMILIGRLTARFSDERLASMERLGGQVLDLVAGLPTLKALGRENGPGRRVRELGQAYNATTMFTLRVAFLSGAALEFITTLSVAIIAVEVGFRLLFGHMDLTTGLLVIMIAPEVYQPLRQVGFHFHASANGVAAAEAAFAVVEVPVRERGTQPAPDLARTALVIDHLSVAARGAWAPSDLTARIRPGRVVALTGRSGSGKTTTSQVLLGLLPADRGRILLVPDSGAARPVTSPSETSTAVGPDVVAAPDPAALDPAALDPAALDLADVDPATWWRQVAWVPQRPVIVPGTVRSNVLGDDQSTSPVPEPVQAAARATGFDEVLATLPRSWDTPLGQGGVGLSVGQRQRLALTRALAGAEPLVILDEPTAHLDAASEAHVLDAVAALRAAGRTVVVIAHRHALLDMADDVVTVTSRPDDALVPERPDDAAPLGSAVAPLSHPEASSAAASCADSPAAEEALR